MRTLLLLSLVLLNACGSIHPRIGMPFNDLNRESGFAGCGNLEKVSTEGDTVIYHVRVRTTGPQGSNCNPNVYYHFRNDILVKIEQKQTQE